MNDLFEIAIQMEKNGESIYTRSIKKVKSNALKSMLEWMASEEAAHGRWFLEQKSKASLETDEANLKQMVPQALQDMMGEKTLSLDDIDFDKFTTVSQLLKTFVGFEEDTILFYELLDMFIEKEIVRGGLKKIILEEKSHVEKLNTMIAALPEESI